MTDFQLNVWSPEGTSVVPVERGVLIGSSPDAAVVVRGAGVAPRHAIVEPVGTGLVLRPLSAAGTPLLCEGRVVVGPTPLRAGDRLALGPMRLRVQAQADQPHPGSDELMNSCRLRAVDIREPEGRLLLALHSIGSLIGQATSLPDLSRGWLELMLYLGSCETAALRWRSGERMGPLVQRSLSDPEYVPPVSERLVERVLATGLVAQAAPWGKPQLYVPMRFPRASTPCGFVLLEREIGGPGFSQVEEESALIVTRLLALAGERLGVEETLRLKAAELERTHGELSAILEALPEGVALIRRGKIAGLNAAAQQLLAPLIDDRALSSTLVVRLLSLQEQVASALGGARSEWRELELPGGRALHTLAAPLPGDGGAVVVIRDMTELERSTRSLRDSEARFRQLAENVREVFVLLDPRTRVALYVSPYFAELWGRPAASLLREPGAWLATVHPDDRPEVELALAEGGSGEQLELEHRVQRPDGAERWVRTRVSPVRDGEGPVRRLVLVSEDVSERRRAEEALRRSEEQLRQAQKMEAVGRLAGGVAHDFNNLLTVIRGYAELALSRLSDHDELRPQLQAVTAAAGKASGLTGQLLAFSRRQVLQPTLLDVTGVVRGMEPILRRLIPEDVELALSTAADTGAILADRIQLEQVLLNLAANGRDAMPDGGRLSIECRPVEFDLRQARAFGEHVAPRQYVLLSVRDTGCGMSPEALEHVFEPFYTTKSGGTGLGLATVHGIVKQSGGHLTVESRQGRGTCFQLLFPRVTAGAHPTGEPSREPARPHWGSEAILLVEDEPEVRAFARDTLSSYGYRVLEAESAEHSLELIATTQVDLVVTDVVMPGMSGPELHRRLVALRPGLRVLFMSGYVDDPVLRRGVISGEVPFLQKPFLPGDLAREVRQILDQQVRPANELPLSA